VHAIEAAGLTKHYTRRAFPFRSATTIRALESLDLEVERGEIFGFLGPNGAGKSTAIRLLVGFLRSTRGSARVLGLDIVRESVRIRQQIGYLPGGIALYESLTGIQLLDYMSRLARRPPTRRTMLCERLEVPDATLRRPLRDYSRGMRQKIGIIQALQHDPELAILDEPTEGLDPLMQRAFYDILAALKRDGRTIFFSSHVLSEVERVCDRVAILRRGRLAATHRLPELLARRRRNVTMRLDGNPPDLERVPGVSGVAMADGRLTCRLEGDLRPFLVAIAHVDLFDLTIEPAHLDEAFLELYEEGEPS
jgi:ABC-2 type transport system ATP-binding protein